MYCAIPGWRSQPCHRHFRIQAVQVVVGEEVEAVVVVGEASTTATSTVVVVSAEAVAVVHRCTTNSNHMSHRDHPVEKRRAVRTRIYTVCCNPLMVGSIPATTILKQKPAVIHRREEDGSRIETASGSHYTSVGLSRIHLLLPHGVV